jgi:hypothetical protein
VAKLAERGRAVMIGTRNPVSTLANAQPDRLSNQTFSDWQAQHPRIKLGTFAEAAAHGELLLNATTGSGSLDALKLAGEQNLNGKVLVDISNPLDFSRGLPPSLFVSNTDSLGEQIRRAFPDVKVVKSLNTLTAALMVNPGLLPEPTAVFVGGNDAVAKATVTALLKNDFGWQTVIDLGDLSSARGTEMVLPLWVNLMGVQQTSLFNFKIVRQ